MQHAIPATRLSSRLAAARPVVPAAISPCVGGVCFSIGLRV